jgi:hypothetical protein
MHRHFFARPTEAVKTSSLVLSGTRLTGSPKSSRPSDRGEYDSSDRAASSRNRRLNCRYEPQDHPPLSLDRH